jgi:lipopolysaccharide/colanic/teichoic acid biosynthesis glycosyltransferase
MSKRLFDIVVSGVMLLVLSPVMLGLAIWVALDSRGGVFYRGVRGGKGNRPFQMLKFRTMVQNAEKLGGSSTSRGDPRITASGHFLRRFKLDELPQLINVFKGDMSLVGPRPQVMSYTNKYVGEFREIFTVRPGITDWASIWNSDEAAVLEGAADADLAYDILIDPTKLRLQLEYVRMRSFATDLRIIYCTARRLVDPDFYPAELANTPRLTRGMGASVSPMTLRKA